LEIRHGEFVAIVGQSGSGKSTLMNVLGCLDVPSAGRYEVNGLAVHRLNADQLARLRRETFGFIFQRYHLVPSLTALENTEIPAVYTGLAPDRRRARARELLETLGLGERLHHRPGELSGGQQQRVSIARALMNGAEVILADEPTGALDAETGDSVLGILRQLYAQGHTIVVVTHDEQVAAQAQRRVRLKDGHVVEDQGWEPTAKPEAVTATAHREPRPLVILQQSLKVALRTLALNRLRTALTLLGIVIGAGSVVAMLGIGEGATQAVVAKIQSTGANLLTVNRGAGMTRGSGRDVRSFLAGDIAALAVLPGVEAAIPESEMTVTVRYENRDAQVSAVGTGPAYPVVRNWPVERGVFFTDDHERRSARVLLLGATTANNLFTDRDPVGQYLLVNKTPFQVIGVMQAKGASGTGSYDPDDRVWVPASTYGTHLSGQRWYRNMIVKAADGEDLDVLQGQLEALLLTRHGHLDFSIRNSADIIRTVSETRQTFTLLLGFIAVISLVVGGIGVMNIMLVSVIERISEIGIRMAVGARPRDVMIQFLIEAVTVCFLGGLIGVVLGAASGYAMAWFGSWTMVLRAEPMLLAFGCAFLTGVVFGFFPARKAAGLSPVEALNRE
ncbi:MAG: MacB family efflux pump subunit, partial [Nevskiales bacterium]|nr:MacB family efflux pump subunit [Nevskiales bacterium]